MCSGCRWLRGKAPALVHTEVPRSIPGSRTDIFTRFGRCRALDGTYKESHYSRGMWKRGINSHNFTLQHQLIPSFLYFLLHVHMLIPILLNKDEWESWVCFGFGNLFKKIMVVKYNNESSFVGTDGSTLLWFCLAIPFFVCLSDR